MTPDQFAAYLCLKGLSDNTIRTYSSFYRRWWGHPYDDPDDMWTAAGVREWSRTLPQSRSSLEQARTVVARACEAQGVDCLSGAVRIPKGARKKQSKALTVPQARRLHSVATQSGLRGLAVLVAMYTGARRSEVACLAWDGVEWGDPDDEIEPEITLTRPKNSDRHTLPLHPTLRRHLGLHHVDGDMWVFPGRYGGHVAPATISNWVADVSNTAEVPAMHPHRLRHTLGSLVVDEAGLMAGQRALGHADPKTTSLYATATDRQMRQAFRVLDVYGDAA